MSEKETRRNHGLHNFEICEHLVEQKPGKFNDWIITTAFYSSIHYIYSELFPGKYDVEGTPGKDYKTFESLYADYRRSNNISKHDFTEHSVNEYLDTIQYDFKFLKDSCHTARYSNYKVDNEKASDAMESLLRIKSLCTP